ncbi:Bcrbg2 [Botrytis cinerea B05.10]|uniref:Bcrbg2 n=1 Tax=Botryotinia fuckeliana (strain B05.10) TaxID=332648 RepID=A0A384K6X0_BOTFB|nr:Bcrbg2 [Botrytis cinerea B05.10]ATZ58573.1 Bcrbg2 [Botrytis cinerea B05.10]
MVNITEKIKE